MRYPKKDGIFQECIFVLMTVGILNDHLSGAVCHISSCNPSVLERKGFFKRYCNRGFFKRRTVRCQVEVLAESKYPGLLYPLLWYQDNE